MDALARSDFPSLSVWSAAETSRLEREEWVILSERAISMVLINSIGGNKTTFWLSLEVSTSFL